MLANFVSAARNGNQYLNIWSTATQRQNVSYFCSLSNIAVDDEVTKAEWQTEHKPIFVAN